MYDFYLDRCLLPVAPESLEVAISNKNETITLINEGEVNILKEAGLTEVEFTAVIPQVRQPYAVYVSGFKRASYYTDYLKRLKTGKKPFQFLVSRILPSGKVLFSTNMKVSLEDYTITENAGDGFDLSIKIKLKQWRDYGTKTFTINATGASPKVAVTKSRPAENSPAPTSPKSYTVAKGDCLWHISKKFYGDGGKYKKIADANHISNPNRIRPGQRLVIPV